MTDIVISCLSQKGGVGKSTMARLIARTYAAGGWDVKIADFNTKQLTSADWAGIRAAQELYPAIRAEPCNSVKSFRTDTADLIVADGKPDSDQSSLEIARVSTLIIVPTGLGLDDLKPQLAFAHELVAKGVPKERILIVLCKLIENELATSEARQYLVKTGHRVADIDIPAKQSYNLAINSGRALSEAGYRPLADRADALGAEIVAVVNELQKAAA